MEYRVDPGKSPERKSPEADDAKRTSRVVMSGRVGVNWSKGIGWVTTALIILFGVIGHGPSTYRVAILFLGPLLWGIYSLRRELRLRTWQFGIFAGALLLHDLGAFGAYGHFYAGLEFDTYVHFVFGIAGAFIVARALRLNLGLTGWKLWVGTVLI